MRVIPNFDLLTSCIIVVVSQFVLAQAAIAESKKNIRQDGAVQAGIQLTGSLQNPAFSPDGKSLVFTRFRKGYNRGSSDIYLYNLKTGKQRVLMSDKTSNVNLPGSVWSKSLDAILLSSDQDPHDEIYMISTKKTNARKTQVTRRSHKQSYEPSFSPDSKWIVFESHDVDVADLGVITKYRLDGKSKYIPLTKASESCTQPNWSPAGDMILYQKKIKKNWTIWTMASTGKNQRQITPIQHSSTDAVFSFNGKQIVYSAENDNVKHANIYMIGSRGGSPSRVTKFSGYDGAPSISPDGTTIAFESASQAPDDSLGTTIWLIRTPLKEK